MTWETFYDRCGDWSESTQIKHISSLTDFGPTNEICDAVGYMSEKAATKLVRKAIASGIKFSAEDLEELDFYVDSKYMEELTQKHTGGMTWQIFYDHFTDWDEATRHKQALEQRHFGPTEEITEIAYDLHDKSLATQFIRNAMAAGVKFNADDVQELDGTVDQTMYEQLLSQLGDDLAWELFYDAYDSWPKDFLLKQVRVQKQFGASDEICDVVDFLADGPLCTEFVRNAMKGGVIFTPDEVIQLADTVEGTLIVKIVRDQALKLTPEQVLDLSFCLNRKDLSAIAELCDVKLDKQGNVLTPEQIEFEREMKEMEEERKAALEAERAAQRASRPGLGMLFLAALAAFGSSNQKSNNRRRTKPHHGHCDGDCANCPPHYGYRYGRWYYGRHHQYGCQYGGNRGGGGLD